MHVCNDEVLWENSFMKFLCEYNIIPTTAQAGLVSLASTPTVHASPKRSILFGIRAIQLSYTGEAI